MIPLRKIIETVLEDPQWAYHFARNMPRFININEFIERSRAGWRLYLYSMRETTVEYNESLSFNPLSPNCYFDEGDDDK